MALMKSVILKKTIAVAAKEGIRSYSVKSVAAESGCSEGLIFHYYRTKDELTDMCYRYIDDEFTKSFVFGEKDLDFIISSYCHFMKENKDMAQFSLEYVQLRGTPVGLEIITEAVKDLYSDMDDEFCRSVTRFIAIFGCFIGLERIKWGQVSGERFKEILENMVDSISQCQFENSYPPF